MKRLYLLAICCLALLLTPAALAQAADTPTVAILRFGSFFNFSYIEDAIIDTLRTTGFVNDDEHAILYKGDDLAGENIRVIFGDANFDFAAASVIVEGALDQGADALIVISTPTAQAAVNITSDMDDRPAVFFTSVFNPVEAGIAKSSCIKPPHVTGIESRTRYEDIVPLLQMQNPDLRTVGAIYSSSETSGRMGAQQIVAVATALGLEVELAPVASIADVAMAAESLVGKGVEAFLIPSDLITISALPALMQVAIEYAIPVFHATANTINKGATVSAGASENVLQGNIIGAMLAGYLRGELDVAATGIGLIDNLSVGLNLDMADQQGIELSQALFERADLLMQDGSMTGRRLLQFLEGLGMDEDTIDLVVKAASQAQMSGGRLEADLPPEIAEILSRAFASRSRMDDISAIVAALHCTDEMIAEQQAALDAHA